MALTQKQIDEFSARERSGTGFGMKKYDELKALGATNEQLVQIAMNAPIVGDVAKQNMIANYDVSSGFGQNKNEQLTRLGASREQIIDIASKAPVVGDRMAELYPELASWQSDRGVDLSRVPEGFDWTQYVRANPDLTAAGINTADEAIRHFASYGFGEDRAGLASLVPTPTPSAPVPEPSLSIPALSDPREFSDLNALQADIRSRILKEAQDEGLRTYQGITYNSPENYTSAVMADKFDISYRLPQYIDQSTGALQGNFAGVDLGGYQYTGERVPTYQQKVDEIRAAKLFTPQVYSFDYRPQASGLETLAPIEGVSLVRAAEAAPVLAPTVQTIGSSGPVAGMKEGGLAAAARQVASAGRGGDTMLAHINPEEAGILKALGGSGTINPETGLPEFIKFKLGRGGLDINIGKKSQKALAVAAGVAAGMGYIPSFIPGMGAVASTGVLAGLAGALGNQNLNAGLNLGLTAYGAGSITQAVAPQTVAGAPTAPGGTSSMSGGPAGVKSGAVTVNPSGAPPGSPGAYSSVGVESVPATVSTAPGAGFDQAIQDALYSPGGPGVPVDVQAYGDIPYESFGQTVAAPTPAQIAAQERVLYNPLSDPEVGGIADLSAPLEVQAVSPGNAAATAPDGFLAETLPPGAQKYIPAPLLNASGTTLAAGTLLGTSLLGGVQERQAYARLEAARKAEEEKKKREYLALFERTLGAVPVRSGGLMKLAGGGMTYMEAGGTTGPTGIPRDVTGTGDGMSDSVPATIEGVQEARLADGEFVIPADVVADIGNGSSNAGSKKLYDMMARIREARHGTTKQPPEINAERMMPA